MFLDVPFRWHWLSEDNSRTTTIPQMQSHFEWLRQSAYKWDISLLFGSSIVEKDMRRLILRFIRFMRHAVCCGDITYSGFLLKTEGTVLGPTTQNYHPISYASTSMHTFILWALSSCVCVQDVVVLELSPKTTPFLCPRMKSVLC